ncbi:MAG: class I SAM-dependent methyltransferase [Neisseriaceae bacterium]|jgi:hypothetical protein|nr:Class SAM-dependent methyltransferase [Pseudomonadota bacterium]RTK97413.1 MAG: class I SAM-dependent methyltransferase [Neisseriaceae bacterium]
MPWPFWLRLPVSLQALALQLLAAPIAWFIWHAVMLSIPLTFLQWLLVAVLQGAIAALLSLSLRMPWWWWWIQFLFWPLLLCALMLPVLVTWAPLILLVLLLVFGGVYRDRVPLFLSSRRTLQALHDLLSVRHSMAKVIDLGCGTGRVTCDLQQMLPTLNMVGIERAFLPFALAWLRSRITRPRPAIALGSFWGSHLGDYDVVYAYLSPAPMPRLWEKVCAEMKDGSLFISNTFEVPGVVPDQVITVDDWNHSKLFIWQIRHDRQGK